MKLKSLFLGLIFFGLPGLASAQLILFKGQVKDLGTGEVIPGVEVSCELDRTSTNEEGRFSFNLPSDVESLTFTFEIAGYETVSRLVEVNSMDVNDLGIIDLKSTIDNPDELIPVVLISDSDLDDANSNQNVSSLVGGTNDIFTNIAAFTFSAARFRIRGLDGLNTSVFFNGVPMNELENGRVYWSSWGGLNDVMRSREASVGLDAIDYTIGGVGGATSIDTRASKQRKQSRVVYSSSNRSYRNRLMFTWGSGQLKNGWSVALSGSRRWSDQGYVEGTYYDAWSYFLSVDKKIGKHTFNLTSLAAPVRRGKGGAAINELYELTNNNYYNPYWGLQNGKVRNSREFRSFQPINILRHDWDISEKSKLTTAVSYQFGKSGSTALDWYDAADPRPNYYRYLPSYIGQFNEQSAALVANAYATDLSVSQIDFDGMFLQNQNAFDIVEDANGVIGNSVSGARSRYIIEERRYDSEEINFNTLYRNYLTDNVTLRGGLMYQVYKGNNFKVLDDLLGGDFYVDINRFAETDFPNNPDAKQNDLDNPNRIITEGDVFGYDYNPNVRKATAWAQTEFKLNKIDFFVGGELSNTQMWREGDVRNGLFPDNSFGKSEVKSFNNYMLKAGATYKFNNRHYLYANGAMGTRAPFIRNAFISPRTRNTYVDDLESEEILSAEAGYVIRTPRLKGRATAYFVEFKNKLKTMSFFNDEEIFNPNTDQTVRLGFVNMTITGIDQIHAGAELALEYKVTSALSVVGAAAIGNYYYSSRANATIVNDADPNIAVEDRTVYMKNYYLPGVSQDAYTTGLRYNGAKYWFANLNVNYFGKSYLDFNPNRRTENALSGIVPQSSDRWDDVLEQLSGGEGMTVDLFGGKSFKFNDYFIYLTIGVNNILDNTELVTGGYEQLRFDFETQNINRFPERRYYMYGRNYFVNLAFRF